MAERLARGSHLVNARRCSHGAVRRSGHPAANDAKGPQRRGCNMERVRLTCEGGKDLFRE